MTDDDVMPRIMRAIEAGRGGDVEGARAELAGSGTRSARTATRSTAASSPTTSPTSRTTSPTSWHGTCARSRPSPTSPTNGRRATTPRCRCGASCPSLHLNVADDLRRLGDPDGSREHLALAVAAVDALPDDGYGDTIRSGIRNVELALAAGSREPLSTHHN